MKEYIHEASITVFAFLLGLLPAALGAAVSLVYEPGLSWRQRFVRLCVGVTVSIFTTNSVAAMWPMGLAMAQGIGFVLGMIAFRATPIFISAATDQVAKLPAALFERIFPRKDQP